MPFSEDLYQRLLAAIGEKVPRIQPCPVCGQDQSFTLFPQSANIKMMDDATTFGSTVYTSNLVLICDNCGCTHFLNANVLGVRDMISAEAQAAALEPEEAPPESDG